MFNGDVKNKVLTVTHPNFSLADGTVKPGEKYVYRESGRRYEVLCVDVWEEDDLICLKLQILKSDPKPYSIPVDRVIDVSVNREGIGFQGMWWLGYV